MSKYRQKVRRLLIGSPTHSRSNVSTVINTDFVKYLVAKSLKSNNMITDFYLLTSQ